MLNQLGKVFRHGKIDERAITASCTLGAMTLCRFEFAPWSKRIDAEYLTVNIRKVEIFDDGVYVTTDNGNIGGAYVGKIKPLRACDGWGGIFNTESEAKKCFSETMQKWKSNIP